MIPIEDIERIRDLAASYLRDRKSYEKKSARSLGDLSLKQAQKLSADMNFDAMALYKLECALHAACVDAGVADARTPEHYAPTVLEPSGWHSYRFEPPRPRSLSRDGVEQSQ